MILEHMEKHTKGMKYDDWFYKGAITLDPSEVEEAWEKLAADQTVINLKFFPESMSRACIATLRERGHLD